MPKSKMVAFLLFLVFIHCGQPELIKAMASQKLLDRPNSMKFLVSVNLTWSDCMETVNTPWLKPNQYWNETEPIPVGDCDKGPLTYQVIEEETIMQGEGSSQQAPLSYVEVAWYTTAIAIQPPSCRIPWNYEHVRPLSGCFINDSQEGYHVTYYWLHILDWT